MSLLSVIVCTRNRGALLRETLASVRQCALPPGWQMELVIVDNGSQDATPEVIAAMQREAPALVRAVLEPVPGLSRARNAGVREAQGELLAFTDDDCLAEAHWLANLIAAFQRDPHVAAVFGQVQALEPQRPTHVVAVKAEVRPQAYRYPCSPLSIGHGNNMAFRRTTLAAAGPFDVLLGAGSTWGAAEDVDMAYRVLRQGGLVRYDPACVIRHRPRATAADVRRTHWRNAIGLGACLGQHWLRGDQFAGKCLWWFLRDLPSAAARASIRGEAHEAPVPWVYLMGVPWGVCRRAGYNLVH
jgi:glycosyltransferase involved in cell wall biosynthesis